MQLSQTPKCISIPRYLFVSPWYVHIRNSTRPNVNLLINEQANSTAPRKRSELIHEFHWSSPVKRSGVCFAVWTRNRHKSRRCSAPRRWARSSAKQKYTPAPFLLEPRSFHLRIRSQFFRRRHGAAARLVRPPLRVRTPLRLPPTTRALRYSFTGICTRSAARFCLPMINPMVDPRTTAIHLSSTISSPLKTSQEEKEQPRQTTCVDHVIEPAPNSTHVCVIIFPFREARTSVSHSRGSRLRLVHFA